MSTKKPDIDDDTPDPQPQRPPDELPPPGDDDPPPRPVRINSVSPIGGALAGGIDVTITGTGFQPEAEVFFGSNQSPEVTLVSFSQVTAKLPPAAQTGSVDVKLVNPDGTLGIRPGAFTYVTTEASLHAEVLGVEPLTVIEDTESEVTIRGRNLIAAYNEGIVALRGSTRVQITFSSFSSSTDAATGIDSLVLTVRVTATPPLEQHERKAIQVLASLRPGAGTDGVFETSRQMFTVLPRAVPVLLAFTANLDPTKPNLVMVVGRNLEGCSLDLGQNAMLHMQKSDEQTVAAIVSFPEGAPVPESAQLRLLDPAGAEAGQFVLTVAPSVETNAARPSPGDGAMSDLAGADVGLTLTPVPGQQILGPTATDSAIFPARGQSLSLFSFDFGDFYIRIIERTFRLQLFNEVRLIPFFDNGVGDALSHTPVLAQVGKLFRLRGMGLLVALHVELVVHIEIVLIIGFRFQISPFGLFNEFFDDYPFAIGSLVITIRFALLVEIDFLVAFVVALVMPGGALKVLFSFNLRIGIDFSIDSNGHFHFGTRFKHKVHYLRLGPTLNNPLPCEGRFQLAEDQGQTVFTDSFGGQVSFYMPREAGQCCIPWDFGLELVRFEDGGPDETVQGRFRADFCLNALQSNNQNRAIVVSDRTPRGFPPPLELDIQDTSNLKAMFRRVGGDGIPIGDDLVDVTEFGYQVEFYLDTPPDVVDRESLRQGSAWALMSGENIIFPRLFKSTLVIIDTGEEAPSFWPGSVTGFDILSFLARGLAPAIRTDRGLPVIVHPPTNEIKVEPTLAFRAKPGDPLTECSEVPNVLPNQVTREIERYEPFEDQREFVLAIKVNVGGLVTAPQTLNFTVRSVQMGASSGQLPPVADPPLKGTGFGANDRDKERNRDLFFASLVKEHQHFSVVVNPGDKVKLVTDATTTLSIVPNNKEADAGQPRKLVPPGFHVASRHVVLSIKLEVQCSANVIMTKPLLTMAVRNDEIFEEYPRVFSELQTILNRAGTKLSGFGKKFLADLTTRGHDFSVLKEKGDELWKDAYETVQVSVKDDRPLYYARLQGIGALRAYGKRKILTEAQVDALIPKFEWPSRGLEADGSISFDTAPPAERKAIVTGFDPFELWGYHPTSVAGQPDVPNRPDKSNPSGLIALALNKKSYGSTPSPACVRTAIFPVRYKEFDAGLVEAAVGSLGSIVLLMTTSENGLRDFYDVERWAGKNRVDFHGGANGLRYTDNNRVRTPGTPISVGNPPRVVVDLLNPGGATAAGDEFLQSTLPHEKVITRDLATQTLKGPHRDKTPFVIDQSYLVIDTTATAFKAGEFRPEPNAGDPDSFNKQPDSPDSSKKANLGSGGNYLSNEIFYRTALVRNDKRPSLASGHFHLPSTDTQPEVGGPNLINGVETALERFLNNLSHLQPRITSFSPTRGSEGDPVTIRGERFDGATAVRIGRAPLDNVRVVDPTQITAEVSASARTAKIEVDTPYGTAVSPTMFRVIRRIRPEDLAALLRERRLSLGIQPRDAAGQLGVTSRTYTRWERGQDVPRAHYRPAIVRFLGHDPAGEPETLGERIRAAREREGLSKPQLAQRLGISASTVHAWEADSVGRPTPRVTRLFEEYLEEV